MRLHVWLIRRGLGSLGAEYGAAIEETLAQRLADARSLGRWALARTWLRELTSLTALAASERCARARVARRQRAIDATWKAGVMDGVFLEVQHALRRLRRSPIFSVATVWTLALALAANVA